MKYVFVLGRNPELSLAELISYLKARGSEFEILEKSDEVALFEIEDFSPETAIDDLGGIPKIGEVLIEAEDELTEELRKTEFYPHTNRKFFYGISAFGPDSNDLISRLRQYLKKSFKEQDLIAMYKHQLSPKYVTRKDIIEEGLDLLACKFDGRTYVARTVAAYNPLRREERDEERPSQDHKISVSIRLAKILLNLAGCQPGDRVLDPFCGTGTILQEALFLGCEAYGIDLDEKRIKDSNRNLNWIRERYGIQQDFHLEQGNAKDLSSHFSPEFDAIVTEPNLGPYLDKKPRQKKARKIVDDLNRLYTQFFREVGKVLTSGARLAIVLPSFPLKEGGSVDVKGEKIARGTGLEPIETLSGTKIELPIKYKEDWHTIGRRIYIFKKDK
ncbi:MAG: TRM11 family SAM-dependent methyltransferase [Candidatus Aenigmatarchaeota archaeon]